MTVFTLPRFIDNFRQTNLGRVAIHEAGHAVIARVLRLRITSVTIKPVGSVAGSTELPWLGVGPLGGVLSSDVEWLALKKVGVARVMAPSDRAFHAHIITLLSGAAAENFFCGGAVHLGARSDNAHIRMLMRYFSCDRPRLKRMAEILVRRHSGTILRVALELKWAETLKEADIDTIIDAQGSDL